MEQLDYETELVTNPLLEISWLETKHDNKPVLRSYLNSKSTVRAPVSIIPLVEEFMQPHDAKEINNIICNKLGVSCSEGKEIIEGLLNYNIIISKGEKRHINGVNKWKNRGWDRALLYDRSSRNEEYADNSDNPSETRRKIYKSFAGTKKQPNFFTVTEIDIDLPETDDLPKKDLYRVLDARHTQRVFNDEHLTKKKLSNLLFHTFEPVRKQRERIKDRIDGEPALWNKSSATSFDIYLAIPRVDDVPPGIYQYSIQEHGLQRVGTFNKPNAVDITNKIKKSIIGQPFIEGCSVTVFFVSRLDRYMWRYRTSRAYRNHVIDITTHAHRLILVATAFETGSFMTPAFDDSKVDSLLGIDGYQEAGTYSVTLGE